MKYLKPLFCLIAFPSLLFAQSNYKPGYVVTTKGDTLKGFIDYREWDETPVSFSFKRSMTDNQAANYTGSDVSYVNINMLESYQSYSGRISMDPVDPTMVKPDNERDTSFRIATVFLKIVEKGDRLALYRYKDNMKERFFIGDAPGFRPSELVYRLTRTSTENTFQKQLSGEALKYNELNDNLEAFIGRSEYSEDNILNIVSRINHISKSDYKKAHYNGSAFNIFIGAGVNINTTTPDPVGDYAAAGGTSYTSYGPQGSIGINVFANPATRALQFRLELGIDAIKYQSLYMSKVEPYVPSEVSYNETAFFAEPQLIYNFYNTDNFKVFADVGFIFYHFNYSNTYFGSQNHDGSEAQEAAALPFLFENSDNAFLIKGGVQVGKHIIIAIGYHTAANNTNGGYFRLSSTGAQGGINYLF